MNYHSIHDIFSEFEKKKVLILGDVMIDAYIYGDVLRISPEAPVPVVNIKKQEKRLGGAANVALNVHALGATPILCSVIGDDSEGNDFIGLLNKKGLPTKGIITSSKRVTTVKNRVLSSSQQLLRIDSESEHALSDQESELFLNKINTLISECDLVIFEDYDKGCLTAQNIPKIIERCIANDIPTVVDPKKKNFLNFSGCSLFKPNLKELKEGIGIDIKEVNLDSIRTAVQKLRHLLHFDHALITLSDKGIYYGGSESDEIMPAHVRSISDVSGAGDTVVSIAGLALSIGLPLKMVAELANLGGGIVCEYLGVVPIDKIRLKEEAEKYNLLQYL